MADIIHRTVTTNGIDMHVASCGEGDLIVLCHGFPECWYSWRHQITSLADAGFHAVAPDQRGYGQTDRPESIDAYNILQLTGDIVGLVRAYKKEKATIVGHDWGALVAWHCALLRPDIFQALVLLSVPYLPRQEGSIPPTEQMKQIVAGEKQFYQLYFQEPGKAEAELETDVRTTLLKLLYSASGVASPEERWNPFFSSSDKFLTKMYLPEKLPTWLNSSELDFFVKEFERTGFRGALNWYRNLDRNWELTPFSIEAKIHQPSLFIAGKSDAVITMYREEFDRLEENLPNLKQKVLVPGAGHWLQQERPQEVNKLLVEFLTSVET